MSVSARTFQIIYIIRQRALNDQDTRLPDFAEFIAAHRKTAPALYSQAYISPSAIQDLVYRMATLEGLITIEDGDTIESGGAVYRLTIAGSQMADLLVNIDACGDLFTSNYKELIVQAVLQQRHRLGQPPANQREVAAIANISLDSARRGLTDLVNKGVVTEVTSGRTTVYSLVNPPMATVPVPPTMDTGILRDLAALDEDDPVPPVPPEQAAVVTALAALDDDTPVPLSALLQDEGPDHEEAAPAVISQDEESAIADSWAITQDGNEEAANDAGEGSQDYSEGEGDGEGGEYCDNWAVVPKYLLRAHANMARAAGLSLTTYLKDILMANKRRMQRALLDADENLIRQLTREVLR